MINNVVLVGRLTADIDLRYTQTGTAVGNFNLAVNRTFTNQNGEREADYIRCVAWRKTAETAANFVGKGSLVGIQGRIQTRHYDNEQGQRIYITEVVAESIQYLDSRNKSNNGGQSYGQGNSQGNYQNSTGGNFGGNQGGFGQHRDPFERTADPIEISDDDLPF
ncbi:single-stranded DNA-binding protein [Bacillus licheniformis]|uniref:single-stranded DNA-binding protein n=1 Tax=Bacillus licheniformis TaxID=1402 RepID=UPI000B8A6830|nr:single-stranded DNA-binding protein [Bacillus licheniformis]MED0689937.1 single-stranded DNA-binding protein [Bacillus licheniformis]MED0713605.1 single-stranded DNA-binding protein [Bacillus licheniformis]MED0789278.1 single-stranded DNA-binding protein [Bacillus licheniformis]TWM10472.1 Single-stranded DNA-binding protein A [Bacillus licheniformis]WIW99360.1 single-stranded DNA-binding protein [Bacillus licheniformis]